MLLVVLTVLAISSVAPATSHAGYYHVDNCYNGDGTGNAGNWSNAFFNDSSRFMWNNACTLGYGMRLVFTGNGGAPALARLPGSAQIEVAGADHFYDGREDEVLRWVRGFLDKALRR